MSETTALIRKGQPINFPEICPRCLEPADTTLEVRHNVPTRFGFSRTEDRFDVPVCSTCLKRFRARAWIIVWPVSLAMIALAVYLWISLVGAVRWVAVGAALGGLVARQYNPSGVRVSGGEGMLQWRFPTPRYTELFKKANRVVPLDQIEPMSEDA